MTKSIPHVFLSYSHSDNEIAHTITNSFKEQNIEYWSDQNIRLGEDWASEIEMALSEASVYVFLVSSKFASSDWAMYEIGYAMARSKDTGANIVPVIIEDAPISSDLWSKFLCLDARNCSSDEVAMKIVQAIHNIHKRHNK